MAANIYDLSATAASNTTIDGVDVSGSTGKVKDGDNVMRSLGGYMAQLVDDLGGVNTVGGTGDAITVTLASGITAYATGQRFTFTASAANTGATTANVNSIGAKAVRKISGGTDVALVAGDIPSANARIEVIYDAAANSAAGAWILLSAAVTFATNAQAVAGTSTTLSVNPNNLAAVRGRRNRVVNPAMQHSLENVNTAGTTTGYYVADQWAKYHVSSAGTLTAQRVQSVTPNGSKDRARITITAADASLAAGEYLTFTQNIEGQEVADLQWGAAAAEQIVVRFGFKGPAGTYAVALHNSGAARSYVALFTISAGQANTDTEQTVIIAGDTTGTWLKDTGIGITLDIVLACGSTFQGAAGWQAGNIMGTSSVSNGMGTVSAVFEIFDVGLYADPDATGVAPAWEIPDAAAELRRCMRYLAKRATVRFTGSGLGSSALYVSQPFTVEMRVAPTTTVSNYTDVDATGATISSVSTLVWGVNTFGMSLAPAAGSRFITDLLFNARM